jgi:hypothetical protein
MEVDVPVISWALSGCEIADLAGQIKNFFVDPG